MAQITGLYRKEQLINTQVIAVVNFPSKQIANFIPGCLVLGVLGLNGEVVLLRPDKEIGNSLKIG